MKIKKGDTVKILYGKDNGKSGRVVAVDLEKRLVVVEGLNIYKRHLKGDGKNLGLFLIVLKLRIKATALILRLTFFLFFLTN